MDLQKKGAGEFLKLAREMLPFAYAPYSGYRVGAVLLTAEGEIFKGVNIENVSLGLSICAERVALSAAVAAGYRSFSLLAIAADGKNTPFPCGACRQVLMEFSRKMKVVVADEKGEPHIFDLEELLPHSFTFGNNKNAV